jgi:hypothetical protein
MVSPDGVTSIAIVLPEIFRIKLRGVGESLMPHVNKVIGKLELDVRLDRNSYRCVYGNGPDNQIRR